MKDIHYPAIYETPGRLKSRKNFLKEVDEKLLEPPTPPTKPYWNNIIGEYGKR